MEFSVLLFPKAIRDLEKLEVRYRKQLLDDLDLLRRAPWPSGKVKKLRGADLWEVKSGDFRALFVPHGKRVVIARVVLRRDLDRAVGRIDPAFVLDWLRKQGKEP